MASTYLTRTPSSTGNRKTFTVSFWHKRGHLGDPNSHVTNINTGNNPYARIYFQTDDTLMIEDYDGNLDTNLKTNRKFRDMSAWYHIVVAYDTTQYQAANRIKIYVNGVQETSLATSTYPGQNFDTEYNKSGTDLEIGRYSTNYLSGVFSHFHLTDGTAYDASAFGETDATTGEWKIKTSPSVTYGTNGFFILKDGNSVTDSSTNSNNFTVAGGTLTKTEDNPSNVFATFNPLIPIRGTPTYQSGNTYFRSDYSNWDSALSTIGATSGKWYFEAKWGGQDNLMIGCVDIDKDPEFLSAQGTYGYVGYRGICYFGETSNARVIGNNNSNLYTSLTTFASGDIIGCAIDLDNREMFVHKNGTYTNSGNPTTRANPYDMSTSINQGGTVLMGVSSRSGYGVEVNFGNGYFSSTAVSSAGTNASGIGIFEYDVPTGYTALSTKGLNL